MEVGMASIPGIKGVGYLRQRRAMKDLLVGYLQAVESL